MPVFLTQFSGATDENELVVVLHVAMMKQNAITVQLSYFACGSYGQTIQNYMKSNFKSCPMEVSHGKLWGDVCKMEALAS